ncbi:uncharacterized protein G2W53_012486 [Senna tora]|uniref:Uncharacterized protein n=1 Tax=Senna tora TaxID=362788 RepID=A0A834TX51_9FABA|nr:uncharacterized protein G2W53_012486 [Senna tora]
MAMISIPISVKFNSLGNWGSLISSTRRAYLKPMHCVPVQQIQQQESCVNHAMEQDGYFVTFVKGRKQMSKVKTSGPTVDVHHAELLDMSYVQSVRSSNVSLFQVTMMAMN